MNVRGYLRQTAVWERKLSTDEWGVIQYAAPETIRVRRTRKDKWQRNKDVLVLVEVTQYLSEEIIGLGDRLDGKEIHAVKGITDFDGREIGCKAFPRPPLGFTP